MRKNEGKLCNNKEKLKIPQNLSNKKFSPLHEMKTTPSIAPMTLSKNKFYFTCFNHIFSHVFVTK